MFTRIIVFCFTIVYPNYPVWGNTGKRMGNHLRRIAGNCEGLRIIYFSTLSPESPYLRRFRPFSANFPKFQ